MNPDNTPENTPRLRFPEFKDAGEWEEKKLGEAGSFIGGGTPDTTNEEFWNGDIQWFTPSEIKNRTVSKSNRTITEKGLNASSAKLLPKGALLITTRATVGEIAIAANSCTTNQGFQSLVVNKENSNLFWYYWIIHHKRELTIRATGSTFPEIGKNEIVKINVLAPSLPEQQKIADCLASLDELIAAESKKLELLKAHKRGLMQLLFPDGASKDAFGLNKCEITGGGGKILICFPRLRFPEFQNAGGWEEKTLGKLGKPISGLTYSPDDVREEGMLVLRSSNIKDGLINLEDCVYVTEDIKGANLTEANDILICVRNGSKALIGKNAIIPGGMSLCTHGAFMTVFRGENPEFVFQLFQTTAYNKQVAGDLGATINSINVSNLLRYKFFIPSLPEQQKIAECLSSLDALLAAQGGKLAHLRQHRKGLMQALFPEVGASASAA